MTQAQAQVQIAEVLKRAVVDALRELGEPAIDFNNRVELERLATDIEDGVRRRVGGMCIDVAAFLTWEELEWINVEVVCNNKVVAYTAIPVYALLKTGEIDASDVDVDEGDC
jgi:hypothetical protein